MAPGEGGGQGSHTATRCCWLLSAAGLSQPRWPRRRGVGAEVCVVRGVGRPRQAARRATAGVERQRHPGASSASRPAQARRKPPSNSLVALAAGTTPRPRVAVCPGVLHPRPRPPPLTAGCGVAVSARADWLHARAVATSVFCCSARAGCVGARAWRRPSHVQPGGRCPLPRHGSALPNVMRGGAGGAEDALRMLRHGCPRPPGAVAGRAAGHSRLPPPPLSPLRSPA